MKRSIGETIVPTLGAETPEVNMTVKDEAELVREERILQLSGVDQSTERCDFCLRHGRQRMMQDGDANRLLPAFATNAFDSHDDERCRDRASPRRDVGSVLLASPVLRRRERRRGHVVVFLRATRRSHDPSARRVPPSREGGSLCRRWDGERRRGRVLPPGSRAVGADSDRRGTDRRTGDGARWCRPNRERRSSRHRGCRRREGRADRASRSG